LRNATLQRRWCVRWTLGLGALLCFLVSPAARASDAEPGRLLKEALELEKSGNWAQACFAYERALHQNRSQPECREGLARCIRRFQQNRRLADKTYLDALGKLIPSQALDVYEQTFSVVAAAYVDRDKADPTALFQRGVQELRFALDSELFRREFLPSAKDDVLTRCKLRLEEWVDFKLTYRGGSPTQIIKAAREAAREQVQAVFRAFEQEGLEARPRAKVAIALEFASGACNALDEYTLLYTPGYFNDLQAALRGKSAGVGVELVEGDKGQFPEVARVYPLSPASDAGLTPGVRIKAIDRQSTEFLTPQAAAERLRGEVNSAVELEILYADQTTATLKLSRRPVAVTSVEWEIKEPPDDDPKMQRSPYIGYLRIFHFQQSTVQEVKAALTDLQSKGAQGLIVDLRGNPGGDFEAAVRVAELFLTEGVIVHTQGPVEKYNHPYLAKGTNPHLSLRVPVAVLIDGETASAAELLAGALQERNRAWLIGQPTYGKCSIQSLYTLDKGPLQRMPGGIRLTVAKFSTSGKYIEAGRGILPHDKQEPANVLSAAHAYLRRVLEPMSGMMPPAA
jgi:C-terminal peptidase prc